MERIWGTNGRQTDAFEVKWDRSPAALGAGGCGGAGLRESVHEAMIARAFACINVLTVIRGMGVIGMMLEAGLGGLWGLSGWGVGAG